MFAKCDHSDKLDADVAGASRYISIMIYSLMLSRPYSRQKLTRKRGYLQYGFATSMRGKFLTCRAADLLPVWVSDPSSCGHRPPVFREAFPASQRLAAYRRGRAKDTTEANTATPSSVDSIHSFNHALDL